MCGMKCPDDHVKTRIFGSEQQKFEIYNMNRKL